MTRLWRHLVRECASLFLILRVIQAQSPPRLLPEAYDLERVVPAGTVVQLPCPIEADPDTLFFEWYRDREPLDAFADDRFRLQGNGVLKIKSVVAEDTGLYACRAVNGFGKVDVNVTLIVLGPPDAFHQDSLDETEKIFEDSIDQQQKGKPRLVQVSKSVNFVVVGSSIALKCVAKGEPRPQITWLKNAKPLPDSNLPSRGGHWVLLLQNLQASDTGNYTCRAQNAFGSVSANFVVKVIDRVRTKPEFIQGYPPNITAHSGESVSLQCLLSSDIPPNVQWLKQVSPLNSKSAVVKLLGESYQILKSTEVIERMDGYFLSKLVFPSVHEDDAGKYICLGANAMGFSSRSAFLKVLPVPSSSLFSQSIPLPLLVAGVICGAILLAGLLGLVLYCHRRRDPLTDTTTTSSTSFTERKHSYVGMPSIGRGDLPSPSRIYIAPGQLHRTVPLNAILI